MTPYRVAARASRVVVKVGSNVVLDSEGRPATDRLRALVRSLAALRAAGREVLLLTSGSVGLGATRLHGAGDGDRQASAAVGQAHLTAFYHAEFAAAGLDIAQLLLTEDDFRQAPRARRLARTLDALLAHGTVPVINENDAVSDAGTTFDGDLPVLFRDNDMLATLVARATRASLIILLSDIDGVYTADPVHEPEAVLIPLVAFSGTELRATGSSGRGRGGMQAKLRAAQLAVDAGIGVVIANGHVAGLIERIVAGEAVGTWFAASAR